MDFKTFKFLLRFQRRAAPVLTVAWLVSSWLAWCLTRCWPLVIAWFFGAVTSDPASAWKPLAFLISAEIAGFICWRVADFCLVIAETRATSFLYREVFSTIISRPARFFENELSGTLTSRINQAAESVGSIQDTLQWGLPNVVTAAVAAGISLAYLSPSLLFGYAVWIVLLAVALIAFAKYLDPFRDRTFAADSALSGSLSDVLGGSFSVLSLGIRSGVRELVGCRVDDFRRARRASWIRQNALYACLAFLFSGVTVVGFSYAYWRAVHGGIGVTQMAVIVGAVPLFFDVSFGLKTLVDRLSSSLAQGRGLRELLESPVAPEPSGLPEISVPRGALEFKNLSFGYVPGRRIFDGLDLSVKPGERVALVGPSGAGKSTLLKLALRLYVPDAGSVLVDGSDVAKFDPDSLRRQVALVPQEPALFHRSVFENVALAREGATREMVEKALRAAHAWEVVERLPNGMDSVVGERGVKLSGGERQRVALARAFVRDARIVLLDEPTSALDSASERAIQSAMGELLRGRTSLTIAHRLSTVMHADRIVVLERGRIVGQGTHAELLAQGGLYAKLWELQAGGMLGDTAEATA